MWNCERGILAKILNIWVR